MQHQCYECGETFSQSPNAPKVTTEPKFCCKHCNNVYHNRRKQRGAMIIDMMMARIESREEARAEKLLSVIDRLVRKWVDEDREAGRKSQDWRPIIEGNPWLRAENLGKIKIGRN